MKCVHNNGKGWLVNVKKTISIFVITAILFTLIGCGDEGKTNSIKKEKNDQNGIVNENSNNMDDDGIKDNNQKTATASDKKVNIKDKSIYYFVVNGKKFSIDDKVKDVETTDLSQDNVVAENDIPSKTSLLGGVYFRDSNRKNVFSIMPINNTNETIKCADSNIGGFSLEDYYYNDYNGTIEICNGITIGTPVEEVEAFFGEPTEKDMREDYENLGIKYTYKAGVYQYFEFEIDKENKTVTEITWRYFDL